MLSKAKDFDEKFDAGLDITNHLDITKSRRPEHEPRRVNVDFPSWMVHSLDKSLTLFQGGQEMLGKKIDILTPEGIDSIHFKKIADSIRESIVYV